MKTLFLWATLATTVLAAPLKLNPPTGLCGTRQDAQAALITWNAHEGRDVGYNLYSSYDKQPLEFHRESKDPLHQSYVIWDAPRQGKRAFVFYLTAIDKDGNESGPSEHVRVDLDSKGPFKRCPPAPK